MYPDKFQWRQNAYEYVFDKNPFDVVCGTDKIRKHIEAGDPLKEIEDSWSQASENFRNARSEYLIYK